MSDVANQLQSRIIAESVAEATVEAFLRRNPPVQKDIPAPLKWAAGVISAVLISGAVGIAIWTVTTLANLTVTVARMDERQLQDDTGKRLDKIEERLMALEQKR